MAVPGWEEEGGRLGGSATAGLQAPLGIPIELFLMCFNFHFLLLENTDGDSLPLIHTEHGADRERWGGKHMHGLQATTHAVKQVRAGVWTGGHGGHGWLEDPW